MKAGSRMLSEDGGWKVGTQENSTFCFEFPAASTPAGYLLKSIEILSLMMPEPAKLEEEDLTCASDEKYC